MQKKNNSWKKYWVTAKCILKDVLRVTEDRSPAFVYTSVLLSWLAGFWGNLAIFWQMLIFFLFFSFQFSSCLCLWCSKLSLWKEMLKRSQREHWDAEENCVCRTRREKKKTSDTENARRHTFPFFVFYPPPHTQKLKEHDDGAGVLSCFGGRQADCKHFEGLCSTKLLFSNRPPLWIKLWNVRKPWSTSLSNSAYF